MRNFIVCGTAWVAFSLASGCGDGTVAVEPGPSAMTVGSGTCASTPFPRRCLDKNELGLTAACGLGPNNELSGFESQLGQLGSGCVGAMAVMAPGPTPDLNDPRLARMFVKPGVRSGEWTCCAEQDPGHAVPTIVTFDPASRALVVRSAEPVNGPSEVSVLLTYGRLLDPRLEGSSWFAVRYLVKPAP